MSFHISTLAPTPSLTHSLTPSLTPSLNSFSQAAQLSPIQPNRLVQYHIPKAGDHHKIHIPSFIPSASPIQIPFLYPSSPSHSHSIHPMCLHLPSSTLPTKNQAIHYPKPTKKAHTEQPPFSLESRVVYLYISRVSPLQERNSIRQNDNNGKKPPQPIHPSNAVFFPELSSKWLLCHFVIQKTTCGERCPACPGRQLLLQCILHTSSERIHEVGNLDFSLGRHYR